MSDANDLLVQRFIDQELSSEERVHVIARLGKDEALRRRVLAFETMALESRRLPRPIVPDDFTANVMARLDIKRRQRTFVVSTDMDDAKAVRHNGRHCSSIKR